MPTIEELKNYGANTDEALSRLMGNESFYLMLIPKVFDDKNFDQLSASIAEGDLDKAFEAAHSLKGVLGHLELILKPVIEITELLRHKEQADYAPLVKEILKQKEALMSLFTDR